MNRDYSNQLKVWKYRLFNYSNIQLYNIWIWNYFILRLNNQNYFNFIQRCKKILRYRTELILY